MTYDHPTDEKLEKSTNRVMFVGVLLLAALAAMFPLYRSFEPSSREDARADQEASLAEEGANLWQFNCASCHGLNGDGGTAPALNSTQFLQAADDDQIGSLIAVGIPGSDMAAYSLDFGGPLTSEQVQSIVSYLRSLEADAPDRPDWRDMVGG
jgi:mono/diheme cytochrome c family protein